MNTDTKVIDFAGPQSRRDEEYGLTDREGVRTELPDTPNPLSQAPCCCPGCFPIWD